MTKNMLSIPEIKKIMEKPDMPNEEAEQIRDACYELVKLANEKMLKDKSQVYALTGKKI